MGAVEQSSDQIESYLSSLEESYGSVSIDQRTMTVSPEQYAHEHETDDVVEVHVKVTNEADEVLHIEADGTPTLPSTTVALDESLEPSVKETVAEEAGVDCRIEDLKRVTILGLHNEESGEAETLYRLAMLFEATDGASDGNEQVVWKEPDPDSHPLLS